MGSHPDWLSSVQEIWLVLPNVVLGSLGLLGMLVAGVLGLRMSNSQGSVLLTSPNADDTREPVETSSDAPVIGWRSWTWDGQWLHGVMETWWSAANTADCPECIETPGWNCRCGIYALKSRVGLEMFPIRSTTVIGWVELSGLVIEHQDGYRAEKATIGELFVDSPSLAREIESGYPGVTVHSSVGAQVPVAAPTPVVAWRHWSFDGRYLVGEHGNLWFDAALEAQCNLCFESPGWSCSCGIYAYRGMSDLPVAVPWPGEIVIGRVELSGLVIEHERGYRARHARIIDLFVTSKDTGKAIQGQYAGIPIRSRWPYDEGGDQGDRHWKAHKEDPDRAQTCPADTDRAKAREGAHLGSGPEESPRQGGMMIFSYCW